MKKLIGLGLILAMLCSVAVAQQASIYKLGDKMDDFTVTLSDGQTVSLYELLEEKKAVLINFWASWCSPCMMEFPFMTQAYDEMSDEIGIVALSIEPSDTDQKVLAIKKNMEIESLPMGLDNGLSSRFNITAIPTSVLVDRFGVICYLEIGSIPDKNMFLGLFSAFTPDDYAQSVLLTSIPEYVPPVENSSDDSILAIPEAADDDGMSKYVVSVTDESGTPVEGVMIQICDETTCNVKATGNDGLVTYEGASYPYEIHVLMAPGYAKDEEVYVFSADGGTLDITLKK